MLELHKTALWFPGDSRKLFNSWILKFYFPFRKGKTHLSLLGFSDFEIKPLYRTITALLIHVEAQAKWSRLELLIYRSHFSGFWYVNYYVLCQRETVVSIWKCLCTNIFQSFKLSTANQVVSWNPDLFFLCTWECPCSEATPCRQIGSAS